MYDWASSTEHFQSKNTGRELPDKQLYQLLFYIYCIATLPLPSINGVIDEVDEIIAEHDRNAAELKDRGGEDALDEILIVGGGPNAIYAALFFYRLGYRVIVVEKYLEPRRDHQLRLQPSFVFRLRDTVMGSACFERVFVESEDKKGSNRQAAYYGFESGADIVINKLESEMKDGLVAIIRRLESRSPPAGGMVLLWGVLFLRLVFPSEAEPFFSALLQATNADGMVEFNGGKVKVPLESLLQYGGFSRAVDETSGHYIKLASKAFACATGVKDPYCRDPNLGELLEEHGSTDHLGATLYTRDEIPLPRLFKTPYDTVSMAEFGPSLKAEDDKLSFASLFRGQSVLLGERVVKFGPYFVGLLLCGMLVDEESTNAKGEVVFAEDSDKAYTYTERTADLLGMRVTSRDEFVDEEQERKRRLPSGTRLRLFADFRQLKPSSGTDHVVTMLGELNRAFSARIAHYTTAGDTTSAKAVKQFKVELDRKLIRALLDQRLKANRVRQRLRAAETDCCQLLMHHDGKIDVVDGVVEGHARVKRIEFHKYAVNSAAFSQALTATRRLAHVYDWPVPDVQRQQHRPLQDGGSWNEKTAIASKPKHSGILSALVFGIGIAVANVDYRLSMAMATGPLNTEKTVRQLRKLSVSAPPHPAYLPPTVRNVVFMRGLGSALNTLFSEELRPATLIAGYLKGESGEQNSAEERYRIAVEKMCATVEALRAGNLAHPLNREFSYRVVGAGGDEVSPQQPLFGLQLRRAGQQQWWKFLAEVVGNGEIAIRRCGIEEGTQARYALCGDPVEKTAEVPKDSPSSSTGALGKVVSGTLLFWRGGKDKAFAQPSHTYGTVLHAAVGLIHQHGKLADWGLVARVSSKSHSRSKFPFPSSKGGRREPGEDECVRSIWETATSCSTGGHGANKFSGSLCCF